MRTWFALATVVAFLSLAPAASSQVGAWQLPQVESQGAVELPYGVGEMVDLDGRRWTADRLRGRVVLIDFWATWCAPCLGELPRLRQLRDRYDRRDFEIIGVMLEAASKRTLVSWLNRNRIDWPQVQERGGYAGSVARAYGVDRLPWTVLIDRDGQVAAIGLRGEPLADRIEELVR